MIDAFNGATWEIVTFVSLMLPCKKVSGIRSLSGDQVAILTLNDIYHLSKACIKYPYYDEWWLLMTNKYVYNVPFQCQIDAYIDSLLRFMDCVAHRKRYWIWFLA